MVSAASKKDLAITIIRQLKAIWRLKTCSERKQYFQQRVERARDAQMKSQQVLTISFREFTLNSRKKFS